MPLESCLKMQDRYSGRDQNFDLTVTLASGAGRPASGHDNGRGPAGQRARPRCLPRARADLPVRMTMTPGHRLAMHQHARAPRSAPPKRDERRKMGMSPLQKKCIEGL